MSAVGVEGGRGESCRLPPEERIPGANSSGALSDPIPVSCCGICPASISCCGICPASIR